MRKLPVLASVTLVLGAVTITGAAATSTIMPATGSVSCGATGSVALKPVPGLTQTASRKMTIAKVHTAALDTCDVSGVTGGRAAITGGTAILNARLAPGASCATLMASLASVNKAVLIVKLTNTTVDPVTLLPTTKTVAVVRPKNLVFTQSGSGVKVSGTILQTPAANKSFGGETVDVQINPDNGTDIAACASGTTPLDHVDFSTAGGSSVSIHP